MVSSKITIREEIWGTIILAFSKENAYKGFLQGQSCAGIAMNLKRSESTISRELKSNSGNGNYSPMAAKGKYESRSDKCKMDIEKLDKTIGWTAFIPFSSEFRRLCGPNSEKPSLRQKIGGK
ncbi:MAG TPA: hypothetical protein DCO86_01240 [Spirochaetaceae bacterium]|nr:hypothetical protein [Spirochaetaceae bacterium]